MAFTPQEVKVLEKAKNDFVYFVYNIGRLSIPNFIGGKHIEETARLLSQFRRTMRISFRSSSKSTLFYLKVMHKILFEGVWKDLDIDYFSYNERLAQHHTLKIKEYVRKNPFLRDLKDLKPLAEVVGAWEWDTKHVIRLMPRGVKGFTRGIHSDLLLCDDILSDPVNPLNPLDIKKVNETFASVILQCLKPDAEIHVAGTALSRNDFYYDSVIRNSFEYRDWPAIIDFGLPGKEKSRWPEFISLEQLKQKAKEIGPKRFQREFQCQPYLSTEAFFSKEYLRKQVVNPNLNNLDPFKSWPTSNLIIGGYDVGRKEHPSHVSIFEQRSGKFVMIHQKFLVTTKGEIWPYTTGKEEFDPWHPSQLEYIKLLIKNFSIDRLYYDATRGELEVFRDQGLIPPQMVPITITAQWKKSVETSSFLDKMVMNKEIELINDENLLDSISSMTNDLVAIETPIGHADAFISLLLCTEGFRKRKVTGSEAEITRGGSSLFEEESKLPQGW